MGSAENSGDMGLRGQSLGDKEDGRVLQGQVTGSPGNRVPAFAMDSCLIWEVLILHLQLILLCLLYDSGNEIRVLCMLTSVLPLNYIPVLKNTDAE